ncbi:MAG: hypothetical protein WCO52_04325 [bacterium]
MEHGHTVVEKKSAGHLAAMAALILIPALVAGGGTYAYQRNQQTKSENDLQAQITTLKGKLAATPTPSPTASATAVISTPDTTTATWTTYTNATYGFTFKYPSTYKGVKQFLNQTTQKLESSDDLLQLTTNQDATSVGSEGCNAQYEMIIEENQGKFDTLGAASYYEHFTDPTIKTVKIGGKPAFRITGTNNDQVAYGVVGSKNEMAVINMDSHILHFSTCEGGSTTPYTPNVAEYEKILSTFTFSK